MRPYTTAELLELARRLKENQDSGAMWSDQQVIEFFEKDFSSKYNRHGMPKLYHAIPRP